MVEEKQRELEKRQKVVEEKRTEVGRNRCC
jgi:hypothetical protein